MEAVLSFLKQYWKILTGIVATIALVLKMDKLVEALREWGGAGAARPAGSTQVLLSETWGWGLAVVAVAFLTSILFCGTLALEVHRLRREQQGRGEVLEKTLRGMMVAADRIAHQLYPLAERPPFAFERVSRSYYIEADGTTKVTAEYTIRAYERPLHFWTVLISAEPDAPGIAFLDEVRFKVHDEAGDDRVAYLLRRNDSHRKEISVFFLPQISPQEAARKIVFSYTWPGMVRRLLTHGDEEFCLQLDSRTQVAEMEYSVYFAAKLHESYNLQCQQTSAKVEGEELKLVEVRAAGHKGWCYTVKNAPAGGFRYRWRFTAKRRPR